MAVRKKSYDNEKDFRFKLDMKNRKVSVDQIHESMKMQVKLKQIAGD